MEPSGGCIEFSTFSGMIDLHGEIGECVMILQEEIAGDNCVMMKKYPSVDTVACCMITVTGRRETQ